MKLRLARHSRNINAIAAFYSEILELKVLGSFNDHDGYKGVFLGLDKHDWHLEFTESSDPPVHKADEDDLLVFYTSSEEEYNSINNRFEKHGILPVKSKNPYWSINAKQYIDPDGFGIIISKKTPFQ